MICRDVYEFWFNYNKKKNSERIREVSFQDLVPSGLLSKNVKTNIYRTINIPVFYGCEAWYVIVREANRRREREWKQSAKRIFVPKTEGIIGDIMRNFVIRTLHQIGSIRWWACSTHGKMRNA
jgi:hypothetical protein